MSVRENVVLASDIRRLRELAGQVRELAEGERNRRVVEHWYALDEGRSARPLILAEMDGGLNIVAPDLRAQCKEAWARQQEWELLATLMHHDVLRDDAPITATVNLGWGVGATDYGVTIKHTHPEDGVLGKTAFHIDPPITNLEAELGRLKRRIFTVDRAAIQKTKALLEQVYDGVLTVRMRGNPWWTLGITKTAVDLIGLENLMLYMYDQPEALHALMAFLAEDHLSLVGWLEAEGLLCLNNADDYIGSGSRGYTRALPQPDYRVGQPVRSGDLWTLIESQETVGVSPELYEEFVFPYEQRIAARFGHIYLGCCEPIHGRWRVVRQLDNLKRVSISPWCDQQFMAEVLGTDYVFSRKPNPALVSGPAFDEAGVRADLRQTLELTKANHCPAEIIMKDVHTLAGEPWRLARWVELAREMVSEVYG